MSLDTPCEQVDCEALKSQPVDWRATFHAKCPDLLQECHYDEHGHHHSSDKHRHHHRHPQTSEIGGVPGQALLAWAGSEGVQSLFPLREENEMDCEENERFSLNPTPKWLRAGLETVRHQCSVTQQIVKQADQTRRCLRPSESVSQKRGKVRRCNILGMETFTSMFSGKSCDEEKKQEK